MGIVELRSTYVQECGSEEEMHDQVMKAKRNEVKDSEEKTEDDNIGATVEIRKSRDESMDPEDEDTSEDDTSEDEETSKKNDDGGSEEPNGISLHS